MSESPASDTLPASFLPKADGQPSPRQRILVVDDRTDLAAAISQILASAGCDAVVADTAENLSALLRALRPSALIIDIMMPGRDGLDALSDVAVVDTRLPILMISGYGPAWLRMGETLGRANGLSHIQTASKPIQRDRLMAFVDEIEALQAAKAASQTGV